MLRIYSFGPTGAGRMQTPEGMTIFTPKALVDGKGAELVRARPIDSSQPTLLARFGRYFQLDEREAPYTSASASVHRQVPHRMDNLTTAPPRRNQKKRPPRLTSGLAKRYGPPR